MWVIRIVGFHWIEQKRAFSLGFLSSSGADSASLAVITEIEQSDGCSVWIKDWFCDSNPTHAPRRMMQLWCQESLLYLCGTSSLPPTEICCVHSLYYNGNVREMFSEDDSAPFSLRGNVNKGVGWQLRAVIQDWWTRVLESFFTTYSFYPWFLPSGYLFPCPSLDEFIIFIIVEVRTVHNYIDLAGKLTGDSYSEFPLINKDGID